MGFERSRASVRMTAGLLPIPVSWRSVRRNAPEASEPERCSWDRGRPARKGRAGRPRSQERSFAAAWELQTPVLAAQTFPAQ